MAYSAVWPSQHQELLLRAALLSGSEAVSAWEDWVAEVDVQDIDPSSSRLLPLLYHNLRAHGVEGPLVDGFAHTYRLAWYKNQMLFRDAAAILRSFHDAGIATMVLKGVALVLLHYIDHGLRPMGDLDLLVHQEQAVESINLLAGCGWTPRDRPMAELTGAFVSVTRAVHLGNELGRACDLHWHVLGASPHSDADDRFWDAAVRTSIGGAPTLALNPTDQLLHVCVHGIGLRNPDANFHWIADAMAILGTSQAQIDWDRLATSAYDLRVASPVADALTYLHDLLAAPVPEKVLRRMQSLPVSTIERDVYRARGCLPELVGPITNLLMSSQRRHHRSASKAGFLQELAWLLRAIQHRWGLDHPWQVPLHAVLWTVRTIWRKAMGLERVDPAKEPRIVGEGDS